MKNKQIITRLVKGGEPTLLHTWKGNELIESLNKQWVIVLPPNSGTADIIDSQNKVTIDLSQVVLGSTMEIALENLGAGEGVFIIPPTVVGDLVTLKAKSLVEGANITLTSDANSITISGEASEINVVGDGTYINVSSSTSEGVTTFTVSLNTDYFGTLGACPDLVTVYYAAP